MACSGVSWTFMPPWGNCQASCPARRAHRTSDRWLARIMPTFGLNPSESINASPPRAAQLFPRSAPQTSPRSRHRRARHEAAGTHRSRKRTGDHASSRPRLFPWRHAATEPMGEIQACQTFRCPSAAPSRRPLSISTEACSRGRPQRRSRVPEWALSAPNSTLGACAPAILELDGAGSIAKAPAGSLTSKCRPRSPRRRVRDRSRRSRR